MRACTETWRGPQSQAMKDSSYQDARRRQQRRPEATKRLIQAVQRMTQAVSHSNTHLYKREHIHVRAGQSERVFLGAVYVGCCVGSMRPPCSVQRLQLSTSCVPCNVQNRQMCRVMAECGGSLILLTASPRFLVKCVLNFSDICSQRLRTLAC
jgi:hypothetical protein